MFRYSEEVLRRFPGIRGGVIVGRGVQAGPSPPALVAEYRGEQQAVLERLGETRLAEIPALAAWRRTFHAFGVKPTQYRSAVEALLRRLKKKGELPTLNTLVDIGNLVSIRHALPVAVLNLGGVRGDITVRLARGDELFTELGAEGAVHPEAGEVVFTDEAGVVHARRWCWRQSAQSAAGGDATDVLITVEGLHPGAKEDVTAAVQDLLGWLGSYAGGSHDSVVLSPELPRYSPSAQAASRRGGKGRME